MLLLDELWTAAVGLVGASHAQALAITGLWEVEMYFQPVPEEVLFQSPFLVVNAMHQGCSFYTKEQANPEARRRALGRPLLELSTSPDIPLRIAALDSLLAHWRGSVRPSALYEKRATTLDKMRWRADIVRHEVERLIQPGPKAPAVAVVGASGAIVHALTEAGLRPIVYDLSPSVVGRTLHGCTVRHGSDLYYHLSELNLVVATGMTLVTNTLQRLMRDSVTAMVPVVVFAQTGSNIAPLYLRYGAATAICEHIPFYNFEGLSEISVFRTNPAHAFVPL